MSDEYQSTFPEFDAVAILQKRIAEKTTPAKPSNGFDPYQMMVNRQKENSGEVVDNTPVVWPEEDIKKLEEFCKEMGIVGFNCGRMSPLAALAFLKQKLGVMDKSTTSEGFGPNYPYSEVIKKKMLLNG